MIAYRISLRQLPIPIQLPRPILLVMLAISPAYAQERPMKYAFPTVCLGPYHYLASADVTLADAVIAINWLQHILFVGHHSLA